jgi:multiple sugar transport system substrate-binding protein
MGSWTPGFEAIQDPEDLGVFRLPGTEGMVASVNWFTVPTYSENVDAAREAVQHFVSPDGQRVWVERGGFIASSTGVPIEAYDVGIMARGAEKEKEVEEVSGMSGWLEKPFQSGGWSQLKGLWASPDSDLESITSALTEAQQSALEEDNGNGG